MDKWSFGLTLAIVSMSGSFVTLGRIVLCIKLMKKVWPLERSDVCE